VYGTGVKVVSKILVSNYFIIATKSPFKKKPLMKGINIRKKKTLGNVISTSPIFSIFIYIVITGAFGWFQG
jgi:hypothetical protein